MHNATQVYINRRFERFKTIRNTFAAFFRKDRVFKNQFFTTIRVRVPNTRSKNVPYESGRWRPCTPEVSAVNRRTLCTLAKRVYTNIGV